MLTAKQHELLLFIYDRLNEKGVPPSYEEMKLALDLKSKSGIHRLITALEERGFLRRLPHRARALEIVRMPDSSAPGLEPVEPVTNTKLADIAIRRTTSLREGDQDGYGEVVPLMGRIAAGVPIEAIQDHSRNVTVPPNMLGHGEHFALEITGDSMINAGILDGDTVLIRKANTANSGDIVVALVDDEEATLKTLRKKGKNIALEAANPAFETRVFTADRVKIQGTLTGLMRSY